MTLSDMIQALMEIQSERYDDPVIVLRNARGCFQKIDERDIDSFVAFFEEGES